MGVWAVDIAQPDAPLRLVTERLGAYSFDKSLVAYPNRAEGLVIVERLADGRQWEVDTGENSVSFTLDGRLIWMNYDRESSFRSRRAEIWLADADGSKIALVTERDKALDGIWVIDIGD